MLIGLISAVIVGIVWLGWRLVGSLPAKVPTLWRYFLILLGFAWIGKTDQFLKQYVADELAFVLAFALAAVVMVVALYLVTLVRKRFQHLPSMANVVPFPAKGDI